MNLFLCGQREFGAEIFRALTSDGHTIVGVAAPAPEENYIDALFQIASQSEAILIPAGTLRAESLPPRVDLIVAAFCHDFIGEKTRNKAKHGGIGYHPSLLPRHRGRDAIEWTLRMRDPITGGSVYWLVNECDGGPIAAQRHCFVRPDDTAKSLYRRELFPIGIDLLRTVVRDVSNGVIIREPQQKCVATWEPSIGKAPLFRPELIQLPDFNNASTLFTQATGITRAWNEALES